MLIFIVIAWLIEGRQKDMSVIFGIHEIDKIIIVADKREYNMQTEEYNDNSQKLFLIHEQLCIAIAGNTAISMAVHLEIEKFKKEINRKITTDDITFIIKSLYDRIIEKSPSLLKYPFCCIYGGIDKDGKPCLVCGTRCKDGCIFNGVSQIIFNPADMTKKESDGILLKNYVIVRGDFSKNILLDIAEKSKYVSPVGDKWVFDIQTKSGTITQI